MGNNGFQVNKSKYKCGWSEVQTKGKSKAIEYVFFFVKEKMFTSLYIFHDKHSLITWHQCQFHRKGMNTNEKWQINARSNRKWVIVINGWGLTTFDTISKEVKINTTCIVLCSNGFIRIFNIIFIYPEKSWIIAMFTYLIVYTIGYELKQYDININDDGILIFALNFNYCIYSFLCCLNN